MKELEEKLHVDMHPGQHGHYFLAWVQSLEQSLPEMMSQMHGEKARESQMSTNRSSTAMFVSKGIASVDPRTNIPFASPESREPSSVDDNARSDGMGKSDQLKKEALVPEQLLDSKSTHQTPFSTVPKPPVTKK